MKPPFAREGLSRRRLVAAAVTALAGSGLGPHAAGEIANRSQAHADDVERLQRMDDLERYVAIDNKCAWPNLTLLDDGAIVATIFGQPSHGLREGSSECWISRDGGRIWTFLSVPAPHAPGTNRCDLAAGRTSSGTLVVLCGGWELSDSPAGITFPWQTLQLRWYGTWQKRVLPPLVSRSVDGGRTWTRGNVALPKAAGFTPFGGIVNLSRARLAVSLYSSDEDVETGNNTAWVFFSDDDGRTWGDARVIGSDNNETTLLSLGGGKLLAASRTFKNEHTEIFGSEDAGRTWKSRGPASLPKQIPAHLLRLQDGSILLTYGSRLRGALGVHARVSRDGGVTWDAPRVLFHTAVDKVSSSPDGVDGGYPSSVQLSDGTIVTAYYCQRIPMHQRYHMGVVRWRAT